MTRERAGGPARFAAVPNGAARFPFVAAGFVPVPLPRPPRVHGVPVRAWLVPAERPRVPRPGALTAPPAAEDDSPSGAIAPAGPAGRTDAPGAGRDR